MKSYWDVVQSVKDLETAKAVCQKLNERFVQSDLVHNSKDRLYQFTKGKHVLIWFLIASDSEMIDLKEFVKGLAESISLWRLAQWKDFPFKQESEWKDQPYLLVREVKGSDMWEVVPCGQNLIASEFGFITSPKTVIGKKHLKFVKE